MLLYSKGDYNLRNMSIANITKHDIEEQLRLAMHSNSLEEIEEIYFERTGKLSFVKKKATTAAEGGSPSRPANDAPAGAQIPV